MKQMLFEKIAFFELSILGEAKRSKKFVITSVLSNEQKNIGYVNALSLMTQLINIVENIVLDEWSVESVV